MPRLISTIAHFLSRSVSYVPRCYSSMRKKPYKSHFFTRRCSYVFYFFTRISLTTLKFTRELSRKDGKQIQIRYRYSRFGITRHYLRLDSVICFAKILMGMLIKLDLRNRARLRVTYRLFCNWDMSPCSVPCNKACH